MASSSCFLDLPPEIRRQVYQDVFRDIQVFVACKGSHECMIQRDRLSRPGAVVLPCLNLTLVSRQIRAESVPEFLANAIFNIGFLNSETAIPAPSVDTFRCPVEQHFLGCLHKLQRITACFYRLQHFEISEENKIRVPANQGGGCVNSAPREIILRFPVFHVFSRKQQVSSCLRKFIGEVQSVKLVMDLTFDMWPDFYCHQAKLSILKRRASILEYPYHPVVQGALHRILREMGVNEIAQATAAHC